MDASEEEDFNLDYEDAQEIEDIHEEEKTPNTMIRNSFREVTRSSQLAKLNT